MVKYYIILLISLILAVFLYYRYTKNRQNKKINITNDNELNKSSKCTMDNPCVIHLYADVSDKQILDTWDNLIKEFDPDTYRFAKIRFNKEQSMWGVKKIPSLRSYGPSNSLSRRVFKEYKGPFDAESMRKFIMEQ